MAVDPLEARERDLINQIRVLYGIDPQGESMSSIDQEMREIQRSRDTLQAGGDGLPSPTRPSRRPRLHRGNWTGTEANPLYHRALRDINAREQALIARRSGSTFTDDQRQQAQRNRELMEGVFGESRQAALAEGGGELDDRFGQTMRLHRARTSARGLTGGSADASQRRRMLTDLFKGRQGLVRESNAADTRARNATNDRRLELERQVKLGTAPDVGSIRALDSQTEDVNEAYRNISQVALGGLFAQGGDVYRDASEAGAYGRRGTNAFALTSGRSAPARGSYT